MTQEIAAAPEPFSQEEVSAANAAEQASLAEAQNQYLTQRVVVLRAQIARLDGMVSELREELHRSTADANEEGAASDE